ncbi:Glucan endo-1,3-beta-glucosidase [Capsicum chinense]|nr:Glucan endo-1,3-beta-glucosidase [Capsicum chinense]
MYETKFDLRNWSNSSSSGNNNNNNGKQEEDEDDNEVEDGVEGIGVNYGHLGDNLPPPAQVINFLKSKSIQNIKIFDPNTDVLKALEGSGLSVILRTRNEDLQALATDPTFATNWILTNVIPHASTINFTYISAEKVGQPTVEVVVTETGWPSAGDVYETIDNAQTYANNLIEHVSSSRATPTRPGKVLETYIFSLFNENQKPTGTEQNFGLFYRNMTELLGNIDAWEVDSNLVSLYVIGTISRKPAASTSQPMDNNATNVILPYLDTMSQDLAMENERLDHMVGQREQVGCLDTRQEEGRSSYVVVDLRRVEVFESPYGDTLGDIRLCEDQTLVVSTQALVDRLDDEIDSSCKNDLCPSSASPYNLNKANVIRGCRSYILGEGRANLGLYPWLLLPFNLGTLLECGNFYTFYLMLGQDDKQCLIVGVNEERQGSSLSLFVDGDL